MARVGGTRIAQGERNPGDLRSLHSVLDLGLDVDQLNVSVKDDVATVSGKVETQTAREKIVLAVGNTDGIKKVNDVMRCRRF